MQIDIMTTDNRITLLKQENEMNRMTYRYSGISDINLSLFNSILTELTVFKKWSIASFFGTSAILMIKKSHIWIEVSPDGSVLIYHYDDQGQKIGCRKTIDNY
jgi:hypothetical protein